MPSCYGRVLITVGTGVAGIDSQADAVGTGRDYRGRAVVGGLTPWSRICFRGALMPAESAFRGNHSWSWLGRDPVWSEASHWVCWFWRLGRGSGTGQGQLRPASGPGSPGRSYSDRHMAATWAGLGGSAWERLCCELRPAAAVTDRHRSSVGITLRAEASPGYGICQAWGHPMGMRSAG